MSTKIQATQSAKSIKKVVPQLYGVKAEGLIVPNFIEDNILQDGNLIIRYAYGENKVYIDNMEQKSEYPLSNSNPFVVKISDPEKPVIFLPWSEAASLKSIDRIFYDAGFLNTKSIFSKVKEGMKVFEINKFEDIVKKMAKERHYRFKIINGKGYKCAFFTTHEHHQWWPFLYCFKLTQYVRFIDKHEVKEHIANVLKERF